MDTNKLLRKAGYGRHPNYPAVAMRAHAISLEGATEHSLVEQIRKEFPYEIVGMRRNTVPVSYHGVLGTDFGGDVINQICTAAKLPCAVRAAVLPDAHLGYALPVGGVLALDNAVSPNCIGFDIACRMTMTVLDLQPEELERKKVGMAGCLQDVTAFGVGSECGSYREHEVMESDAWGKISKLGSLKSLARRQLGSSGGGNHFADLMTGEVVNPKPWLPLAKGEKFTALVTHSGSRGTGFKLARHYSKLAKEWTKWNARGVPKGYEWLPLDSDAGKEYWLVMQAMGEYAQANHHLIHDHFLKAAGLQSRWRGENHHNFAWMEEHGGKKVVVHRKGATPAQAGVPGIIPGSMSTPAYLVEGKGDPDSLCSTAHGAGRVSSRTQAKRDLDKEAHEARVARMGILAIGVGADESEQAYKDIDRVISLQSKQLEVVAKMLPKVVVMGGRTDDGD